MKKAERLIGSLIAMGYSMQNIAVAGGCLRDAYFEPGKQPKDIDVVMVLSKAENFDELLLPHGWDHVQTFDSNYGGEVKSADFARRIDHVIKVQHEDGTCVDLILACATYVTCEQFISDFDFNLNQFMMSASTVLSGTMLSRFLGPSFGVLIETRGTEVHPHRRARMIQLADSYGWDVSEFQGELL